MDAVVVKYRGVRKVKTTGKFTARIYDRSRGACVNLGTFDYAVDAARAYDEAAINMFGSKATLNFPVGNVVKYKGVYPQKSGKFGARVYIKETRSTQRVGTFDTAIEAAKAHDREYFKMYGPGANLNFPGDFEISPTRDDISPAPVYDESTRLLSRPAVFASQPSTSQDMSPAPVFDTSRRSSSRLSALASRRPPSRDVSPAPVFDKSTRFPSHSSARASRLPPSQDISPAPVFDTARRPSSRLSALASRRPQSQDVSPAPVFDKSTRSSARLSALASKPSSVTRQQHISPAPVYDETVREVAAGPRKRARKPSLTPVFDKSCGEVTASSEHNKNEEETVRDVVEGMEQVLKKVDDALGRFGNNKKLQRIKNVLDSLREV